MTRFAFFAGLAAVAGFAGGCGSSVDAPLEVKELAEALCEAKAACLCHDREGCREAERARWDEIARRAEQRGLEVDQGCADRLTADVRAARCTSASPEQHPCRDFCAPFHGNQARGEKCSAIDPLASDCAQGLVCHAEECKPPCSVLSGRPVGSTCAGSVEACALGTYCAFAEDECRTGAEEGSTCFDIPCADGLRCDSTSACSKLGREGAFCNWNGDCEPNLWCDWNVARCEQRRVAGSFCSYDEECLSGLTCADGLCATPGQAGERCAGGFYCADGLTCVAGTCGGGVARGEPCDSAACAAGNYCDFGAPDGVFVCKALIATGEPCNDASTCLSGHCPHGACAPAPAVGEDCSLTGACALGLSCAEGRCIEAANTGPSVCSYGGW